MWGKRMIEWHTERTVAVLDVEYHGVSADLVPMLNDLAPFCAARHCASQIDRTDLFVFSHWDRVLDYRLRLDRRDQQGLALFHIQLLFRQMVHVPNLRLQFAGKHG